MTSDYNFQSSMWQLNRILILKAVALLFSFVGYILVTKFTENSSFAFLASSLLFTDNCLPRPRNILRENLLPCPLAPLFYNLVTINQAFFSGKEVLTLPYHYKRTKMNSLKRESYYLRVII